MLDPARPGLVTLLGAAGMGKTRLARHVAQDVAGEFTGGAWFVELAPVVQPASVADVALVGIGGRRGVDRSALDAVGEHCRRDRVLVVLDNCEHVLRAVGAVAAVVVEAGGVVLATSREPLRIADERTLLLPSLGDEAAVELFVSQASRIDSSFQLHPDNEAAIAEICRRLDGMPLAIELAASRVHTLSVTELLARLGARFRLLRNSTGHEDARQRTLQGAVQWSYDLLSAEERHLFCRLSVFAGGFTLDAAHRVAASHCDDEVDVIDLVDALIARSMVVADVDRPAAMFTLLETMRHFGAGQLDEDEANALRARHAAYYLTVAEDGRWIMRTPRIAVARAVFEAEWDNLRVAFDWMDQTGDVDGVLRLVWACESYAGLAIRLELLAWAERAISLPGARLHWLWPRVASATSALRGRVGDLAGATTLAEAAWEQERADGCDPSFGTSLAMWLVRWTSGDSLAATDFLPILLRVASTDDDPVELGDARYIQVLTRVLAEGASPDHVRPLAEDALRDAGRTRHPYQVAIAYLGLLAVEAKCGGTRSRELFGEVCQWAAEAGSEQLANNASLWMALFPPRDDPLEALTATHVTLIRAREHEVYGNLELSIYALLPLLVEFGRPRPAALLLGGLTTLETSAPDERGTVEQARSKLGALLGPQLEDLVAEGRQLTRQHVLAIAIEEVETLLADRRPSSGNP